MNEELLHILDQIRTPQYKGIEGYTEFFRKEGIRYKAEDLTSWLQFLSARFGGPSMGELVAPEWLSEVICDLAKDTSPHTICDPCAGLGFLAEALREACKPDQISAFTCNDARHELCTVLIPEVNWQMGDALDLLEALPHPIDLVASALPMGASSPRPLKVTLASGQIVELSGNLDSQLMVASSVRLSESGRGLFVVSRSFFSNKDSAYKRFAELGLGVEAAFSLPSGTFAPYTKASTYLVVVRRRTFTRMFVGQLSSDANTNLQVISNFRLQNNGGTLELGKFVETDSFRSFEHQRTMEKITAAEKCSGIRASTLADLEDPKLGVTLGKPGGRFSFEPLDNAIYVPMIGNSDVVVGQDDLKLKPHNYAQVVINPARSNAPFVARFLNSDFGKELRQQAQTGFIPKLNKQTLRDLPVLIPDLMTQQMMLKIETRIIAEQNTLTSLQIEIEELRRELWGNPGSIPQVENKISSLAHRLGGEIKQHAEASLDQWFESLPFPLASILRAWQATPINDFKTKYDHLLHFFEATAQFVSVIFLSAFTSNQSYYEPHRQKLKDALKKQHLNLNRATFGAWKLVVENLGKQTRKLLSENGKSQEDVEYERQICADMFADPSLSLPATISRTDLGEIISRTNKMRNDWSGHGGIVGEEEAKIRNEKLFAEVQKLRGVFADFWNGTQMIQASGCRHRKGVFEHDLAVLKGSNSEFLKEIREMSTCLDVDHLYLLKTDSNKALKLLQFIRIGASPQSAKNACYFFNRLDSNGARFVSYHFKDQPEMTDESVETKETIKLLSADE